MNDGPSPARMRSTAREVTLRIAKTSPSSMRKVGMSYVATRSQSRCVAQRLESGVWMA